MRIALPRSARSTVAVLAVTVGLAGAGCTSTGAPASSTAGPVVTGAWARVAAAGGETAVYLTITNPSDEPDALLSASGPAIGSVMIHATSTDSTGMTGMQMVDRLEIPGGATVRLEPGALHLMASGLASALTPGAKLELDLVFEHAGTVVVQADIRQG